MNWWPMWKQPAQRMYSFSMAKLFWPPLSNKLMLSCFLIPFFSDALDNNKREEEMPGSWCASIESGTMMRKTVATERHYLHGNHSYFFAYLHLFAFSVSFRRLSSLLLDNSLLLIGNNYQGIQKGHKKALDYMIHILQWRSYMTNFNNHNLLGIRFVRYAFYSQRFPLQTQPVLSVV